MVKTNKRKTKRDPLPDGFGSYEAAAEFGDTHDLTDYEDSERVVTERADQSGAPPFSR